MTPDGSSRTLQGRGLLVLGHDQVESVEYWLSVSDEDGERVTTSGWIAARFSVLEALWRNKRWVTLVLSDGRTLQLQLTSEFGACIAVGSPA